MNSPDEPFLSRWSRLKRDGARNEADRAARDNGPAADKDDSARAGRLRDPEPANGAGEPGEGAARRREGLALEEVKSIDIDALHFDSDFKCFMEKGVSDDLRNKALRKLWTSNPIFGHMDGLDDCCEDFSDAVWASPDVKTAYRIGRGFLTDEEVLAAEEFDKPQRRDAVATEQASTTVASTSAGRDLTAGETEGGGGQSDIGSVGVAEPDPAAELAMNGEACNTVMEGDGAKEDTAAPDGTVSGKRA
jgi:hypothetical protein